MTAREVFENVRVLIDEWTTDGIVIPDADVADLQAKSIKLINMAQKELYRIGDLFAEFEFSQKPQVNNIENPFDVREFTGDTLYIPEDGVEGKSYYVKINEPCTVSVQTLNGTWSDEVVINHTGEPASYKGNLGANNGVRFKVTGTTYATLQNLAVYKHNFNVVPDFEKFVPVQLPENFKMVSQIVNMELPRGYKEERLYKWQGKRELYVSREFEGNMRIIYKPVPATVTSLDQELEVDDITAEAIAYYVGARLAPYENKDLVNYFEQKFLELKGEFTYDEVAVEESVEDVIWGGGYGTI